jgi:hypothetical protein
MKECRASDEFVLLVQVGEFVVSNADYIVDSLCRELRHLDINQHVPDVLSSMLSYIGAARDILPLLEEPVCFLFPCLFLFVI